MTRREKAERRLLALEAIVSGVAFGAGFGGLAVYLLMAG